MREWLHGLLREKDGTPSTKRAVYVLAVVASIVFCAWEVWKHGLSQQVTSTLQWLTGGSAGAYAVSRFAEDKGKDQKDQADDSKDSAAAP